MFAVTIAFLFYSPAMGQRTYVLLYIRKKKDGHTYVPLSVMTLLAVLLLITVNITTT